MDSHLSVPTDEERSIDRAVSVGERLEAVHICFDRPPVNAFTPGMLRRLHQVLIGLEADPRPLLLSGSGGAFSAGFDIKLPASEAEAADALSRDVYALLRDHPAPVVAAVEGAAVGFENASSRQQPQRTCRWPRGRR